MVQEARSSHSVIENETGFQILGMCLETIPFSLLFGSRSRAFLCACVRSGVHMRARACWRGCVLTWACVQASRALRGAWAGVRGAKRVYPA